jgi:tetratricopeptide (TPR) repeat protein
LSAVTRSGGGFAPAKTLHSTTLADPDLALFRTLTNKGEFGEAMRLCMERVRTSRAEAVQLRWWRDAAIVERMTGRPAASLSILSDTYARAQRLLGVPFGKHLHGLARSLQILGRYDEAFDNYGDATHYLKGEPVLLAQANTNIGRCYTDARRPESSHTYFDRALTVAESHADLLLQGEVWESWACAFEAEGKYAEGFEAAARSVAILAMTRHEAALTESMETWLRLREKLTEGVK